jgi:serine/threonine protein kinase
MEPFNLNRLRGDSMIGSVAGNYKIVDKIGEGGMGAVYKGIDMMLEREVAIKVLRPELARQPDIVERFRIEAVTLAKLNHPNIATLFNFFRQGNDYFMVMEFVRGETLENRLRRTGAMDPGLAIPLFCQALEGIDHAHWMGIIHRDIKPANMMLTEAGSIKVMDFGIARVLGSARMTKQGNIIGTIEYMSPEQVLGQETDSRSDIYSLGILLYEMLTGGVPFSGDSEYKLMQCQIEVTPPPPRGLSPGISPQIESAVMKALAKSPADRFGTAAEFRAALLGGTGRLEPVAVRLDPAPPVVTRTPVGLPPMGAGQSPIIANAAHQDTGAPETRVPPPGQPWPNLYGGPVKETRLPGGPWPDPTPHWQSKMALPASSGSPSLFSKLNWKHYAGALILLIVLMAVPFIVVLLSLQSAGSPANEPKGHDEQQVLPTTPSPRIAAPPASPVVAPTAPPITQPSIQSPGPAKPASPGDADASLGDMAAKKALAEKREAARKAAARDKARRRAEAERALRGFHL